MWTRSKVARTTLAGVVQAHARNGTAPAPRHHLPARVAKLGVAPVALSLHHEVLAPEAAEKRMWSIPLRVVGVATAALMAAACSSSEPEAEPEAVQPSSVSASEYAEQANQICRDNVAEMEEALGPATAPPKPSVGRRLVRNKAVPIIRKGNQQMRELERPADDEEALDQLFDDMDTILDGLLENPDPFFMGPNPFASVDERFISRDMTDCAG